jgi:hypothetical protein
VTNGVSEMDRTVQRNASIAQETSASSEELNSQAQSLRNVVLGLVAVVQGEKARKSGAKAAMADQAPSPAPAGNRRIAKRRPLPSGSPAISHDNSASEED